MIFFIVVLEYNLGYDLLISLYLQIYQCTNRAGVRDRWACIDCDCFIADVDILRIPYNSKF